jgi:hypothetical protein
MRFPAVVLVLASFLRAEDLAIVKTVVSEFAGGPAVSQDHEFTTGQRVHFSFAVSGFPKKDGTASLLLDYVVEPVDCLGVLFDRPVEGRLILTTRRSESRPIQGLFVIPLAPRAGEGKFRVTVHDRVSEQVARTEIPFNVASNLPEPGERFEVSGFQYFSSEYSDKPLSSPKFRPGETAWGRFQLSTYQTVENNRYRLSYGVTLRNKAGKVVFQEGQAVAESRESFYPRTHVPGVISVRLESNIQPGDYLLEIAAVDEIANARTSATFPLRVQ